MANTRSDSPQVFPGWRDIDVRDALDLIVVSFGGSLDGDQIGHVAEHRYGPFGSARTPDLETAVSGDIRGTDLRPERLVGKRSSGKGHIRYNCGPGSVAVRTYDGRSVMA